MIALWIILGLIVLIGLLFLIPLRVFASCQEELQLIIKYGPFLVYDSEKQPPMAAKSQVKKPAAAPKKKKRKIVGTLLEFLGLPEIGSFMSFKDSMVKFGLLGTLKNVLLSIKRLFERTTHLIGKGRFKKFRLSIRVGDEDCGDAALQYGQVCAVVFPLMNFLEHVIHFSEQKIDIRCDYDLEETAISFEGQLNYRTWHLVRFACGLITNYFKSKKEKMHE